MAKMLKGYWEWPVQIFNSKNVIFILYIKTLSFPKLDLY